MCMGACMHACVYVYVYVQFWDGNGMILINFGERNHLYYQMTQNLRYNPEQELSSTVQRGQHHMRGAFRAAQTAPRARTKKRTIRISKDMTHSESLGRTSLVLSLEPKWSCYRQGKHCYSTSQFQTHKPLKHFLME